MQSTFFPASCFYSLRLILGRLAGLLTTIHCCLLVLPMGKYWRKPDIIKSFSCRIEPDPRTRMNCTLRNSFSVLRDFCSGLMMRRLFCKVLKIQKHSTSGKSNL